MQDFRQHWQLDDELIYLNHAAVSPWPIPTQQAVSRFAEENSRIGSQRYPYWLGVDAKLRQHAAKLIGSSNSNDIALIKNTSEGLSFIAYGLQWQNGDNIVISNQEFPSNRVVWESLSNKGVEVRQVDLAGANTPEQALIQACDKNTKLLSISSVQFASGLRMFLEVIGEHCRKHDILFCVDAIQSLGAEPFDAEGCFADFVVADGHKWMAGPEGLGIFYVREAIRDQINLNQFGWHMIEDIGNYDRQDWEPAHSARRFECGSPNMLGVHALQASLNLLLDVGLDRIGQAVRENADYLMDKIRKHPQLELVTNDQEGRYLGIVSFRVKGADHEALYHQLMQNRVMCALRHGALRFSPHYYTPKEKLDVALEKVLAM